MSSDTLATIRHFLVDHHAVDTTVVAAVSGGVDSVMMLDALQRLAPDLGLTIVVAHANHNLRSEESDNDARFVEELCKEYSLPFSTCSLDVKGHAHATGMGIEASARTLRYEFLEQVASTYKAAFVAVGHNADDAAETFVAHIARGSGIDGLTSHRPSRRLNNTVMLIRPILGLQRNAIVEYAHTNGLQWREDSSNAEQHYQRNAIRHEVMPAMRTVFGPDVAHRIARSAELLRSAQQIVQLTVKEQQHLVTINDSGGTCIAIAPLTQLPVAVQQELLRYAIQQQTHVAGGYHDTKRVSSLIQADAGSRVTISGNIVAWRERDEIRIQTSTLALHDMISIQKNGNYVAGDSRLISHTTMASNVNVEPNPDVAYLNADCIEGEMQWRVWQNGERFIPFGMQQQVLVADLLTNAHIPTSERRARRVVADAQGILWVCGLRQAERTRITSTTQTVTTLRIQ